MSTDILIRPEITFEEHLDTERPWLVFLWNDDVNSRGYVIRALEKVLECSREKAAQLMHEADGNGKTVVFSGDLADATAKATALHGWTLNATVGQDT